MGDFGGVLLAVFLLAANAFFVGAEFALISARRSQIEPRAQAGSRMAAITLTAMEQVSRMMAGARPASRSARSASVLSASPRSRT
ncbi:CNNM domain-containing protein [Nocardioides convexus]|uniref:CNNM domain-containing protein n=1 Tax=Nocardioides convexus TaxID=2712224 RepID=UPI00241824A9|nr:CNNM domain-containing protein [Nocardioides convexus]